MDDSFGFKELLPLLTCACLRVQAAGRWPCLTRLFELWQRVHPCTPFVFVYLARETTSVVVIVCVIYFLALLFAPKNARVSTNSMQVKEKRGRGLCHSVLVLLPELIPVVLTF